MRHRRQLKSLKKCSEDKAMERQVKTQIMKEEDGYSFTDTTRIRKASKEAKRPSFKEGNKKQDKTKL